MFVKPGLVPVLIRFSLNFTKSPPQNSKMLPPSKRFKMENSVPVHHNGLEKPKTGTTGTVQIIQFYSIYVALNHNIQSPAATPEL